ncbi:MAG: CHAT domain-containing protein, partial [Acidobacteriia bacterium]|nr:CHAT domain-containing protein [Terriglobia bacterium]
EQYPKAKTQLEAIIANKESPISLKWEAKAELARLFVKAKDFGRAQTQFEEVIKTLDQARAFINREENRLAFSSRQTSFYTDYIGFLVEQHAPLKALLATELIRARTLEEGLGKSQARPAQVQMDAVHAFLHKHEKIILVYWLAHEKSFLWAITPSAVQLFILPPRDQIDARVARYRNAIVHGDDVGQGNEDGLALYNTLIGPAQKLIPREAKVDIIADGNLGKLNFETLLVPGRPPRFWIEKVELESASSIALLIRPKPEHIAPKKLLLIGNAVKASAEYPPLAHAGKEIEKISAYFSAADKIVLSGSQAVPSAYATSNPGQFENIDFVAHGFASDRQPLDSAIILSPEPGSPQQIDKQFKLYAREIVNIKLHARVVIISACSSAGDRAYAAEGLVGLAWAFLRAGAHQVIAALWDVDDESTPKLMDDFYAEWQKNKDAASALRAAKLKMLRSNTAYSNPYFWAPLQLYTGS